MRSYENFPQRPGSHNLDSQHESRFPPKKARVVHLNFIVDERERSTVEHLCVFQDECIECIYVPENSGKTCKKGPEIIECFKEWVESDVVEE